MQRRVFIKISAIAGGAAAVSTALWLSSRWSAAEAATDSSPIVFNQLGYLPNATKLFTLREAVTSAHREIMPDRISVLFLIL